MASLIRHGRISNETWPSLDAAALQAWQAQTAHSTGMTASTGGVLIPLALWREQPAAIATATGSFGVLLQADDDPGALAAERDRIAVIAIHFARFADGRGYSSARLLRGRYGYRGELRAVGDVLCDQLFYMKRVGFDAFELRADQDPETALSALAPFSESYQAAIDQPLPLFRRRVA